MNGCSECCFRRRLNIHLVLGISVSVSVFCFLYQKEKKKASLKTEKTETTCFCPTVLWRAFLGGAQMPASLLLFANTLKKQTKQRLVAGRGKHTSCRQREGSLLERRVVPGRVIQSKPFGTKNLRVVINVSTSCSQRMGASLGVSLGAGVWRVTCGG